MARLFAIALVVGLLPCGLAGPACAQKYKSTADCIQRCNTRWGFPGMMMGNDPWGSVMHSVGKEIDDWNLYVAKACGEENATSSSAATALPTTSSVAEQTTKLIEQGLGTHSIPSPSSSAIVAIPTFTSLRFVASASRLTTSTTTSHSTTATHTTPRTTSTLTKPETPTHTTAQPAHTTTQTNSNSNGDSNGSNSNTGNNGNTGSSSNTNTGNTGSSNSGSGGNGSRASNADVQAYLNAHNTIRAQHGAVAVTWNVDAAGKAQEWADKCLNKHSGGTLGPLGENLAAGTGTYTITQAVEDWTNEVSEYNPSDPVASHFTQVVWKATTSIGCAVQTCDGIFAGFGAAQYYVCEYAPQGNVEGLFGANVQA